MDNLKGMGWMVLASLGFALADTCLKLSLNTLPVGQVMAFFGGGGALIFGLWAKAKGQRVFDPTLFTAPFIARLVAEAIATVSFVTALALIDLSLLSAIIQANPLLVTIGAVFVFGQNVGWRRWLAIVVGLGGVLLIVRPGGATFEPAALLAVAAAIGLAARDLATRAIPQSVSTLLLAAWGFAAVCASGLAMLPFQGGAAMPEPRVMLYLIGGLAFVLVAYYAITAAMRIGEIAVVTPFRYSRLVFALILAVLVFGERPDALTLIGAGIVIATGLYTLWREQMAAA